MDKYSFQSTNKLYHYTSRTSAIRILWGKTLKFGKLSRMNDINEVYRCLMYTQESIDQEQEYHQELDLYQQISFCRDYPQRGFNIPAMWGHYAENGYGVCLAFDKSQLTKAADECHYQRGCIHYNNSYNPDIYCDSIDARQFFEDNAKKLFFEKTRDWRYEQEYRIVARFCDCDNHYLNISDSLMAVVMYFAEGKKHSETIFGSSFASIIAAIVPDTTILEYGIWDGAPILRDRDGNDWLAKGDCQVTLSLD